MKPKHLVFIFNKTTGKSILVTLQALSNCTGIDSFMDTPVKIKFLPVQLQTLEIKAISFLLVSFIASLFCAFCINCDGSC